MAHITSTKMHQITKTSSKYKKNKMIKMAHITYTKMHKMQRLQANTRKENN